jgi:hypothetical protein
MVDFSQLLSDDEPTALEASRAQAAALRRQRTLGMLSTMTGDTKLGAQDAAEADKGEGLLNDITQARRGRAATNQQHLAQLAQMASEGALGRANQVQLERERGVSEDHRTDAMDRRSLALAGLNINEKRRESDEKTRADAAKAALGKPIDTAEGVKINNALQALPALKQLQDAYRATDWRDPASIMRYDALKNALAGPVAAGALPAARETPGLMEEFKGQFPGVLTRQAAGDAYFDTQNRAVRGNIEAQLAALEAGGASPAQVAVMRKRLADATGEGPPPLAAAAPAPGPVTGGLVSVKTKDGLVVELTPDHAARMIAKGEAEAVPQ